MMNSSLEMTDSPGNRGLCAVPALSTEGFPGAISPPTPASVPFTSPDPVTVSFPSFITLVHNIPLQIKQEYDETRNTSTKVFRGATPADKDNFYHDVSPLTFVQPSAPVPRNPRIQNHPSILPSHERANYSGPGTPMPCLSPSAYPYAYWENSSTAKTSNPFYHSKRSKRRNRHKKNDSSKRSRGLAIIDKLALTGHIQRSETDNIVSRRCLDARHWLNEKAARTAKGLPKGTTPRFVDRGTSPINFGRTGSSRGRYRDAALSPIRCIEPFARCETNLNDKSMD